jgi:hypothetical protein
MKTNQASWERVLRVVAGAAALAGGYFYTGGPVYASVALMAVGAVLVVTGLVAYCPAWHLLGISTRR